MIDEIKLLFDITEEKTGINKETILSGSRKTHLVDIKRIIGVILRRHTKMRLWQIGEVLGGLDHSCVSHYLKTVQGLLDTDYKFRENFVFIENNFTSNRDLVEIKLESMMEERKRINKEIFRLRKLVEIKKSYKKQN
jgi:predicted transcriptional regulator